MAQRPGRTGRPWRRTRIEILTRDGHLCQIQRPGICTVIATTVDHIHELALGGDPLDKTNLRAACRACNSAGGAAITNAIRRNQRRSPRSQDW